MSPAIVRVDRCRAHDCDLAIPRDDVACTDHAALLPAEIRAALDAARDQNNPQGLDARWSATVWFQQRSPVTHLVTVQLAWGGLFDAEPVGDLHLVRGKAHGTPGPLLCGINHHAKDGPGFSVGGGVIKRGETYKPCEGCVTVARREFPGLPIWGTAQLVKPFSDALGVELAR